MRKQIVIYIFALFVGLLAGIFAGKDSKNPCADSADTQNEAEDDNVEYRATGYQFISPLLECDSGENIRQGQTAVLKNRIEKIINEKLAQKSASGIAVYFRDLSNGPWFGINEDTKFAPASLMKVPVMIAYYKLAESNPEVLEKKIVVEQSLSETFEQSYRPSQNIEVGKYYSIEELIFNMIAYSDNDALTLLLQNIDQNFLLQSYTEIGVIIPGAKNLDDELTVKEYSSFFRILYNASYLNRTYSERALQTLSRSDFQNGIVAGLPGNIQVAHKFGERYIRPNENQSANEKQLHDCGIVYESNHPYLVCIMSKGLDFDELSKTMQEISRVVYENVKDTK